ncbi:MAG: MFS transporter [Proteobacteria bacterium]|nr:MFS transporter [Pseudomonadota bacterium]
MKAKEYLQVFSNRRMAVTTLLAISSGLPFPLVSGTLDVWMRSENVDLALIGIFSLVTLPYSLKVFWAPLMDRFRPRFLHPRAAWMIITQVALMAAIILMGGLDPVRVPWLVAVSALVVSFLGASQDIAIDGYRAELLSSKERGAGAALASVGGRVGFLVSGSLALVLSQHLPWSNVYWIMAGFMSLGILGAILSPATEEAAISPKTLQEAVVVPFRDYLSRKKAVQMLLFILLFKLGDVVAGKMLSPFLMDTGFSREEIGLVNKGFGMVVSIVGGILGGGLYAKWGLRRSLWIFGSCQMLSNFVFVAQYYFGKNHWMLLASVGIENFCGSLGSVAFVAFLMSLCNRGLAGTQYALLSSFFALTRTLASTPTGFLAEFLGWPRFFVMSAALAFPGLLMLRALWNDIPEEQV